MLIPYRVDVPMYIWPISNFVIIDFAVMAFCFQLSLSGGELLRFVLGARLGGIMGKCSLGGKRAKCPACSQIIQIPEL